MRLNSRQPRGNITVADNETRAASIDVQEPPTSPRFDGLSQVWPYLRGSQCPPIDQLSLKLRRSIPASSRSARSARGSRTRQRRARQTVLRRPRRRTTKSFVGPLMPLKRSRIRSSSGSAGEQDERPLHREERRRARGAAPDRERTQPLLGHKIEQRRRRHHVTIRKHVCVERIQIQPPGLDMARSWHVADDAPSRVRRNFVSTPRAPERHPDRQWASSVGL